MAEQASENSERIYLQPIAAPSILGLYAFAGERLLRRGAVRRACHAVGAAGHNQPVQRLQLPIVLD